ncbi:MAG TPA: DUF485 domain-containing protein [Actinomycetes bacterium]|nr:DUF485 domain-containing protein [Actinomycetes bacterium]
MARSRSGRHVSRGEARRVRPGRAARPAQAGRRLAPRALLDEREGRSGPGVPAELIQLQRRHSRLVWPLTAAFLGWYFLFVLLVGWAPDAVAAPVFGWISVGYLLFLSMFALVAVGAIVYTRLAASRIDPLSDHIRERLEHVEEIAG